LELLNKWFSQNEIEIDKVLCSPARRTQETFAGMQQAFGDAKIEVIKNLYNGTLEDYLDVLWSQASERIILIGHNPTCDELARYLTAPSSPAADKLMAHHFSTATMAVFEYDAKSWSGLGKSGCQLMELVRPKELEQV